MNEAFAGASAFLFAGRYREMIHTFLLIIHVVAIILSIAFLILKILQYKETGEKGFCYNIGMLLVVEVVMLIAAVFLFIK